MQDFEHLEVEVKAVETQAEAERLNTTSHTAT